MTMAGFSVTQSALAGFRVVREHPEAAALWVTLQVLIAIGIGLVATVTWGPDLAKLHLGAVPTAADLPRLAGLWPMFAVTGAVSLVVYSILCAAMNRAILKPRDRRFAYFRLGPEEVRQLGLTLILLAMAIAVYVAVVIVIVVVSGLFGAVTSSVSGPIGTNPNRAMAIVALGLAGMVGVFVFLGVRFSLASAQTFATGRISLFGSWVMTRGRFWPIVSTYGLALALYGVVWLLGFTLITAVVTLVGGGAGGLAAMVNPDLGSLRAFFSPPQFTLLVMRAALSGLLWPLLLTPPATIYLALDGRGAASRQGIGHGGGVF
jgi:hypothetical protein